MVPLIRQRSAEGFSHTEIAKEFDVDSSTVCRIVNRKTYANT